MFRVIVFWCVLAPLCLAKTSTDRKIKLPEDDEGRVDDFFLLSLDHPSKISFRPSSNKDYKFDGVIERLNSDASSRSVCSFPVFGFESASYHIKLRSMENELEVFAVIKMFEDSKNNSMEVFVIDMEDCKYTKSEIMKGYDYLASGGSFLVLRPGDKEKFEVFSFDGDKECGGYMCKRVFSVSDKSFGDPAKFSLLQGEGPDWAVKFLAGSVDDGYFAVTRKDEVINILSLAPSGDLIEALVNNTEARVHLLKISTQNGKFGFCYTTKNQDREVHCIQLDHRMKTRINITTDVGYVVQDLAVHNLRRGGLLLLTVKCPNRNDRCEEHEVNVVRLDPIGLHEEFTRFRDPGCAPRWQQQFNFFEDDGRVCLYYACDIGHKDKAGFDKVIRSRCF